MGNVYMEASQINYRGGSKKMSVEEAIKAAGTEITPEEKTWIDSIPTLTTGKADNDVIAPEFDSEAGVYAIGDLVMYEGKLYEFTTAHETVGEWDPTEVSEKVVSDEIDTLKSGLTNIDTIAVTNEHALITQYQVSAKMWGKLLIVSGFFSLDDDITGTQTTLFHVNQTVLAEAYTSVVSSTKNAFGRLKLATNGDIIADDPMSGQQWFSFTIVALTT